MLDKAKTLEGCALSAHDGDIGTVKEFLFDDKFWTIRYLVADTGTWLAERLVLISPFALSSVNREDRTISVDLKKRQIEDSPKLDSHKPVSRQLETTYNSYYGWPAYWGGMLPSGSVEYLERTRKHWDEVAEREDWDPNLRGTGDVAGHEVQATDGEIGHIEDFIIDDKTWTIRYLVVSTRNWWPGKTVLISPEWIDSISWSESKVFVHLTRDAIRNSPEYTDESSLTREYEASLHRHYDRKDYWSDQEVDEEISV
jgi:hypothetical protein